MIYKFFRAFLLIIFLLFSRELTAQTPNFDKLKAKFDQGLIFKSAFSYDSYDSYTGETYTSTGQIWINETGYKLESEDQLLVVDGETSRVYDSTRNRVIISEYVPEDDDFAPSRMLSGVDSTYTISEKKADQGTRVILTSTDDFSIFTKVEILVNPSLTPLKITAWDISENVITTTFNDGSFVRREDSVFTLTYPGNAEIVDMRQ